MLHAHAMFHLTTWTILIFLVNLSPELTRITFLQWTQMLIPFVAASLFKCMRTLAESVMLADTMMHSLLYRLFQSQQISQFMIILMDSLTFLQLANPYSLVTQ